MLSNKFYFLLCVKLKIPQNPLQTLKQIKQTIKSFKSKNKNNHKFNFNLIYSHFLLFFILFAVCDWGLCVFTRAGVFNGKFLMFCWFKIELHVFYILLFPSILKRSDWIKKKKQKLLAIQQLEFLLFFWLFGPPINISNYHIANNNSHTICCFISNLCYYF